jgi:hypothetical protein
MRRMQSIVISSRRLQSSYALAIALVLAACSPPSSNTPLSPESDGGQGEETDDSVDARHTPPPPPKDAGSTSRDAGVDAVMRPPDAGVTDAGTGGGGGGGTGMVGCYSEGSPAATCALPTHCCFTNYSAAHNGACTTDVCSYGTISCDGPEDCPTGQRCCAHAIEDPDYGTLGYTLACQSTACGAAPLNQELCHPTAIAAGTCATGTRCVTTVGNDNDLPRTLYICR